MGRNATGIDYTTSAPRLELSAMLRAGYFTKDGICKGGWSWTNGDRCEIVTHWHGGALHMEITTYFTDYTRESHEVRQLVNMRRMPSNLGKGEVLYFICPRTFKACRILYRAYSSHTWRSREGFSYRLYYPQQSESGWARHPIRESNAERKLERLYSMRATSTYKGIPTRRAMRIAELEAIVERLGREGWAPMNMPPLMRRAFTGELDLDVDLTPPNP